MKKPKYDKLYKIGPLGEVTVYEYAGPRVTDRTKHIFIDYRLKMKNLQKIIQNEIIYGQVEDGMSREMILLI